MKVNDTLFKLNRNRYGHSVLNIKHGEDLATVRVKE